MSCAGALRRPKTRHDTLEPEKPYIKMKQKQSKCPYRLFHMVSCLQEFANFVLCAPRTGRESHMRLLCQNGIRRRENQPTFVHANMHSKRHPSRAADCSMRRDETSWRLSVSASAFSTGGRSGFEVRYLGPIESLDNDQYNYRDV